MKGFYGPAALLAVMILVGAGLIAALGSVGDIAGTDQLKRFSSCSELSEFLEEKTGSYGYFGTGVMRGVQAMDTMGSPTAIPVAEDSSGEAAKGWSDDFSTTNIQVEGVDEADIVKSDGKYLYIVSEPEGKVFIVDAYPAGGAEIVSEIEVNGSVSEIYVNDDRLVVFSSLHGRYPVPMVGVEVADSEDEKAVAAPGGHDGPVSAVLVYDVSDRSDPSLARNLTVEGNYQNSRMIGDYVYVISRKPVYSYGNPGIPRIMSGASGGIACGCAEVYYFDVPASSYQFTTITSVNLMEETEDPQSKVFLLGYGQNLYVSKDNIYITYQKRIDQRDIVERMVTEALIPSLPPGLSLEVSSVWNSDEPYHERMNSITRILNDYTEGLGPERAAEFQKGIEESLMEFMAEMSKEMEKSSVHRISISGGEIEYAAGGSVPGTPLNQFSMDEHEGYFRIATTTSGWAGGIRSASMNHVYVLDSGLKVIGRLENLAPGESIYSTRFMGDRLYMVTFERIDPFFVIDLSDPYSPSVLGKLKIPGYSQYLHPYGEDHIIGVGMETEEVRWGVSTSGVKLSLYDVSDVSDPVEVSKYVIGGRGSYSYALHDHKAFLFDRENGLLVIPARVSDWKGEEWNDVEYSDGAQVFSINPEDGFVFRGEITHSENKTSEEPVYYPRYDESVRRALYISDVLYTLSPGKLIASSLDDLSEIKEIEF